MDFIASLLTDEYPGCPKLTAEELKKIEEPPFNKKNLDSLLFGVEEPKIPLEKLDEVPESKREITSSTTLPHLLLNEEIILEKSTSLNESESSNVQTKFPYTNPAIQHPMEDILANIHINDLKIKFLSSQNRLLEYYITQLQKCLDSENCTPEQIQRPVFSEFLKMYPLGGSVITGSTDPILEFLKEIPCSLHEINFLYDIVKKHESRNRKL